jgi:hypothetical protein
MTFNFEKIQDEVYMKISENSVVDKEFGKLYNLKIAENFPITLKDDRYCVLPER